MKVHVLSGGAAQGLVGRMETALGQAEGIEVAGTFGAVGAMKEQFTAGAPCDLLILTEALIGELARDGRVRPETCAPLGAVATGVAVLNGAPLPDLGGAAGFKRALGQASGLYFPDPERATAGIHFMKVLRRLGLDAELAPRLRPFPNGGAAMRELAKSADRNALGCTQVTEIVATPGVTLAGPLPQEFALVTVYALGVPARAAQPDAARRLARLLTGPETAPVRAACGFQ
jgi:molybdate transport system substrate-binding protein